MLWPPRSGLVTSILIILSPCCKDKLQIEERHAALKLSLEGTAHEMSGS